jgi:protein MpaA
MLVAAAAVALAFFGASVDGRQISVKRAGAPDAAVRVLVIGQIHGDEPAGLKVVRALRKLDPPRGVAVWSIRSVNPDGAARGIRQNARGVDLNRNFARGWQLSSPGYRYYGGPRPFSEPESRAVRDLVKRIRPRLTIWYHQPFGLATYSKGADRRLIRRYARMVDMPAGSLRGKRPGTATAWQNHRFPKGDAFVVELKAGTIRSARARRHARVILKLAKTLR